MKKHKLALLISVGIVVLIGLALFTKKMYSNANYEAVAPKRGHLTEAVYALGKVKTDQRFEVKIGLISTVKNLFVQEGQFVRKDQKLIEFDTHVLFRAPFDGTITYIANRTGETALPQMTVVRLENLMDRYIELSLEQEGALRVKVGQKAKVSFESLRGQVLDGEVTAVFSRDSEFLAHVHVKNLEPQVLPGMTADVSVEVGSIENALLIPLKAVSSGYVSVRRKNNKTEKVKLEIGHVDGEWAEVKNGGLNEGDHIMVPKTKED